MCVCVCVRSLSNGSNTCTCTCTCFSHSFVIAGQNFAAPSQFKWQPLPHPFAPACLPASPVHLRPLYKMAQKKVNFKKLFQINLAICFSCCLLVLTSIHCHCFNRHQRQKEEENNGAKEIARDRGQF